MNMRHKFFILAVLFSFFLQKDILASNIDQIQFEKTVDYVNCSLTEAFINSTKSDKNNSTKIGEHLINNTIDNSISYKTLSNLLKQYKYTEVEKSLSSKIDQRKNKFQKNMNIDELIAVLLNNNDLPEMYRSVIAKKTEQIKNELEEKFKIKEQQYQIEKYEKESSIQENISNLKNEILIIQKQLSDTNDNSFWNFSINIWTLLLSVLFSVLIGFFLYKIIERNSDFLENQFRNVIKQREPDIRINTLARQINELEALLKRSGEKVIQLENAVNRHIQDHMTKPVTFDNTKEIPTEARPQEDRPQEFYMSTPNKDGSFNQSSISDFFRPTASFYRFVLQHTTNNKAHFYFVDNEKAVSTAVNYPDTYIEPVCFAENAINFNAKRIITKIAGVAEKNSDKWIVIEKAIISYE
jgi:hypothetical protein